MYNDSLSSPLQTLVGIKPIVDGLLLLLSDKEKNVIIKRFNLDNGGKYTLEEIGQEFSVTRERIRQIEKSALLKMKRNVFNTSLKSLHEYVAGMVREHGGLVREDLLFNRLQKELPEGRVFDKSSAHLTFVLHENLDCVGNTIDFHPYIKDRSLGDETLKMVANHLIDKLMSYGDAKTLSSIYEDLKQTLDKLNFDLTKIKSLIAIDKRLTILDDNLVGLMEWRHIHPRTLRDKILFILRNSKKPLHFTAIAKEIESKSFDGRKVNVQAVHNELIRHDNFILIGRGIYALREWGYERGTVADVIEGILKEKGELDQQEIIDLVLQKRQVKKITIILSLKNSEKFERVGRKQYKLR